MLLPVLVFLSVSLAVGGVLFLVMPTRSQQRLQQQVVGESHDLSAWTETASRVVGPFAKLSAPEEDWDSSALRVQFLQAGLRSPQARPYYFAAKTLLPLLLAGVTYTALRASGDLSTLTLLLFVLVGALVGCYLPNLVIGLMARRRQREIFENFPDASDLMLVCVEAGLGLDTAMVRVADEMRRKSVALAEELHLTILEMRAGGARDAALRNLALRTGVEETNSFATMLTQADRFGTSIGESLRVFSDDLRHRRQMRAEERAAKIPTKMLVPLVTCIFPSVILVILGPAIIQIVRVMLPLLASR